MCLCKWLECPALFQVLGDRRLLKGIFESRLNCGMLRPVPFHEHIGSASQAVVHEASINHPTPLDSTMQYCILHVVTRNAILHNQNGLRCGAF